MKFHTSSFQLCVKWVAVAVAVGWSSMPDPFLSFMIGKLTWRVHRNVSLSLDWLSGKCWKDSRDEFERRRNDPNLKTLRVALLYQLHSVRAKYTLSLLLSDQNCKLLDHLSPEIQIIENHSYRAGSSAAEGADICSETDSTLRLWRNLLDAMAGLRECRRLDAFDTFSIFRISDILFQLAATNVFIPFWVQDSFHSLGIASVSFEQSLHELRKLFDKKRSQIVALWLVRVPLSLF